MLVYIIIIALLIICRFFLVASETALTYITSPQLSRLPDKGQRRIRSIETMLDSPDKFQAVCRTGRIAVSIGLGVISVLGVAPYIRAAIDKPFFEALTFFAYPLSVGISFLVIAYLDVVLGDLVPRAYALKNIERVAYFAAWLIELIHCVSLPFISFSNWSARMVSMLLGIEKAEFAISCTRSEDHILQVIQDGYEDGVLGKDETRIIKKVFQFADKTVAADMVPRPDIEAVPKNIAYAKLLELFQTSKYSRIPVYDGTIDNIMGVVFAKDLLGLDTKPETLAKAKGLIREVYAVPETKLQGSLLREFRKKQIQMAVVLDEFGGTAGLITMEDLLESIVGEIEDEYDMIEPDVQKLSDSLYAVDPGIAIEDFNDTLNVHVPGSSQYTTVGGFILSQLGRKPEQGDKVSCESGLFEVKKMEGNRITLVVFEPQHTPENSMPLAKESEEAGHNEKTE
ncbi:MAG: hemolysin family protein [Pseudomonadota bacterium]